MNGVTAFVGDPALQLADSIGSIRPHCRAMRAQGSEGWSDADKILEGAMQRLRNLVVPQTSIDECARPTPLLNFRFGSEAEASQRVWLFR